MNSAIESIVIAGNQRIVGHAALGHRGGVIGSVKQQTHDGDTIKVRAVGNLGVRFLGVDAPEISFQLPKSNTFTGLSNEKWVNFLKAPFANFPGGALKEDLEKRISGKEDDVAWNHYRHAQTSEDLLEDLITKDIEEMHTDVDNFKFYLAFAHEVMDGYGRLLCFINRDQPDRNKPGPRPLSYNMRLLKAGMVVPYFIWPNVDPWRSDPTVPTPNKERYIVGDEESKKLREARDFVKKAREHNNGKGKGVYKKEDKLILMPFEIRFLAREKLPTRFIIDLSAKDDVIYRPENYFKIKNEEDRLFIPPEFIERFKVKGWKVEGEENES